MTHYIGGNKIKKIKPSEDGTETTIIFKDEASITLKTILYNLLVRDKVGQGDITDNIRFLFATKFLDEMALYGLDIMTAGHVSKGIENLIHNNREKAIGKAFDCKSQYEIKLDKIC